MLTSETILPLEISRIPALPKMVGISRSQGCHCKFKRFPNIWTVTCSSRLKRRTQKQKADITAMQDSSFSIFLGCGKQFYSAFACYFLSYGSPCEKRQWPIFKNNSLYVHTIRNKISVSFMTTSIILRKGKQHAPTERRRGKEASFRKPTF